MPVRSEFSLTRPTLIHDFEQMYPQLHTPVSSRLFNQYRSNLAEILKKLHLLATGTTPGTSVLPVSVNTESF